jgi:hypothetical protein
MTLWRIHLVPQPGQGRGEDVPNFCITRKIVGIGWGVEGAPTSKDEYLSLYRQVPHYPKRKGSVDRFLNDVKQHDLVWTRKGMTYYLGEVGEWEYRGGEEYKNAEIFNVRPYDWIEVSEDEVPGVVVTGFIKGQTIRKIPNPHAVEYSRYLYAKRKGYDIPKQERSKEGILELIGAIDLEDVVAIYLQRTKQVVVFPTTSKKGTPDVECYGVSSENGEPICWQVKTGNEKIIESKFAKFEGKAYLFQLAEWQDAPASNCVRLSVEEIYNFVLDPKNKILMPKRVRTWLDYAEGN